MPLSETEQQAYIKTAPTSVMAVHLGYDRSTKGHHVYVPLLRQFTVAHGLRFVDNEYFVPDELKRNETYIKKPKKKDVDLSQNEIEGTRVLGDDNEAEASFAHGMFDDPIAFSTAQLMNSDVPSWCLNPKDFDEATHKDNPLRGMWIESMDKEIMGKMKNGPMGFAYHYASRTVFYLCEGRLRECVAGGWSRD